MVVDPTGPYVWQEWGWRRLDYTPIRSSDMGLSEKSNVMLIATSAREFLVGRDEQLTFKHLTVEDISVLARDRWIVPGSRRRPDY